MGGLDTRFMQVQGRLTREQANRISEALEEAGLSHSIIVGCHASLAPPVVYRVDIHVGLSLTSEQIEAMQAIVRAAGYRLAFAGQSFTVVVPAAQEPR